MKEMWLATMGAGWMGCVCDLHTIESKLKEAEKWKPQS